MERKPPKFKRCARPKFQGFSEHPLGVGYLIATALLHRNPEFNGEASEAVGVPTPIAGAGLPGVGTVLLLGGFVWWRRERSAAATLAA